MTRPDVMWIFLAAIGGLLALLWSFFGVGGTIVGLLIVAAIAVALLREPSGPPHKQTAPQPLPLPPSAPAHIPPSTRAPSKPGETPLPAPPASLTERPCISAAVEVRPIKLPCEEPGKGQRRKEPRFELIPHKMGGINARIVLPKDIWDQLSKMVISSNGGKCCECPNHQAVGIECHEVWEYEWEWRANRPKKVGVMRLIGLRPLCHLCHMGKHIKFAESQGELPQVMAHLTKLYNGLTEKRLKQLIGMATASSKLKYKYAELDLTYLNDARFAWIHEEIGRKFTTNEMPDSDDDGPIRQRPGRAIGIQPLGEPLH